MRHGRRGAGALAGAVAIVALLAACASGRPAAEEPASADGRIDVVASSDVWGSIVTDVGAGRVAVTSILDDPAKDPHEYQATVRDRLDVSRAALVVENGGGYDDFMARLAEGTGGEVLDAVRMSGRDAGAPGFNEHVWYDLPTVDRVADAVSAVLQRKVPEHRSDFRAALARFHAATAALAREEAGIRRLAGGRGVVVTEAVPLYVTGACGLVNRTPAAFTSAVEDGRDVPPGVLQSQLDLVASHAVAVLAVNEQTEAPMTDRIVAAARSAHVPVVGFRETLPDGGTYLGMFHAELAALREAVAR